MGGGGKRTANDKRNKKNKASNSRRRGSNSKSFGRGRLFVEGGCLADWQYESPCHSHDQGRNLSSEKKSGFQVGNVRRQVSATRDGTRKPSGTAIEYRYPSGDLQGTLCSDESNENVNRNGEKTLVLVNPRGSEVVAYLDQTPPSNHINVEYTYSYGSNFVLGESFHKGLGFCDEPDVTPTSTGVSGKKVEDTSASGVTSSSFEKDMNATDFIDFEAEGETIEEFTSETSPVNNLGFLSIGGIKLYTQDMSEVESDEDNADLQGPSNSEEVSFSESDSEDIFDTDSDIDEDIAQDYLEGIGGSENIIDAKWLLGSTLSQSDEESSSSSGLDETLEKLSGIALQEASMEYGMKKVKSRKKYFSPAKHALLSPMDDLMLVKDGKTTSAKKKHVSRFPHSRSVEDQSKTNRRFPGEKKKYWKEMTAMKRRERMLHRGVDIQKINSKLEEIVLDGVDMFTFQPMHPRDCSQVRRLAAIYRLKTSCQGSGKKRFVMVTRTQHTSIPSASDKLRLKKLLGAGGEDAELIDVAGRKKAAEGNAFSVLEQLQHPSTRTSKRSATHKNKGASNMSGSGSGRKSSYANQPMSFVSSGVMNSETVEVTAIHIEETDGNHNISITSSANIGSFEVHTKGFGSKIMAKMGYTEGRGLGKDGQGMSAPIEVIQRPKSLGLGMDFSNDAAEPVNNKSLVSGDSAKSSINKPRKIGTFEKHTKGFGSKMMAKMGFMEGMGLGRHAQGMTIPLAAVRLPKSRGLGATARS